jgi:hypothetical protein
LPIGSGYRVNTILTGVVVVGATIFILAPTRPVPGFLLAIGIVAVIAIRFPHTGVFIVGGDRIEVRILGWRRWSSPPGRPLPPVTLGPCRTTRFTQSVYPGLLEARIGRPDEQRRLMPEWGNFLLGIGSDELQHRVDQALQLESDGPA